MRKSLSQSSPGCSPQRALANCKMASYPDDYNGDSPFGCFGNFPYYFFTPLGVGGSVSEILGNVGRMLPFEMPFAGWTKEEVALFGCLGAVRLLTSLL